MTRSGWRRRAVVLVAVCVAFAAVPAGASAKVRVFSFTGAEQRFKIPKGVKKIRVVAIGGRGGRGRGGGPGGSAGWPWAPSSVKAGKALFIEVGGNGGDAPGGFPPPGPGACQRGCCRRDGWTVRASEPAGGEARPTSAPCPARKAPRHALPLDRRGGGGGGGSGESGFDGGGAGGAAGASGAPGDNGVNGDPGGQPGNGRRPGAGRRRGIGGLGTEEPAARSPWGLGRRRRRRRRPVRRRRGGAGNNGMADGGGGGGGSTAFPGRLSNTLTG